MISGNFYTFERYEDKGAIVCVTGDKTKECTWMADNTPFSSRGYEVELKFIEMADNGTKIESVRMTHGPITNRFSLSTLYV